MSKREDELRDVLLAGAEKVSVNSGAVGNPDLIRQAPEGWVAPVPLTRLAREAGGRQQMMNIVAVGAVVALSSIADWPSLELAVRERAPHDSR